MPGPGREDIVRSVFTELAAAREMPEFGTLRPDLVQSGKAWARTCPLPDEEESVRLRRLQYLEVRAAFAEIPVALAPGSGDEDWLVRLPEFIMAFAPACDG